MQNLTVALAFARCGVRIFPCREIDSARGKSKSPYIEGGWHNASASENAIFNWWREWPNAAVGLPCRLNGIIALDADRHGQEDGVAALSLLFERHKFEPRCVPCISTPRNGQHFLFRRPIQLMDTKARIAPAIDIRDNAYIVAAGSTMANGRGYQLRFGTVEQVAFEIGEKLLLEFPAWLIAISARDEAPNGYQQKPVRNGFKGDIRERLAGLIRAVLFARPGQRNCTLHWAACRAGELVNAGKIHPEVAAALLVEAATQTGLNPREVRATILSGFASIMRGA